MPTAMIYTINLTKDLMKPFKVDKITENTISSVFSKPEVYY